MGRKGSIHLLGRKGAAVQPETMAILAGSKAMDKKFPHIFGRNAFAVILDAYLQALTAKIPVVAAASQRQHGFGPC